MEPGRFFPLERIHPKMYFSVALADFQSVAVLKREQRVHKTHIGVDVRHGQGMGRDPQYLCQRGRQVCLGRPRSVLLLGKADIGGLLREAQRHTKIFLRHAAQNAEKVNAFSNRHNGQLLSGFLIDLA